MPATFEYTGNGNALSNGNLDERVNYSYNESSGIYIEDFDYGSITSSIDEDEDYGSIVNSNVVGQNYKDFGLITINETIVPFGSIFTDSFGDISLVKINIGQVSFAVLGEAKIFTTPIEFGSGVVGITGTPIVRINFGYFGTGNIRHITGSAEASVFNPVEEIQLFKISGYIEQRSTKSEVGSGSLFTFIKADTLRSPAYAGTTLFTVSGTAVPVITVSHVGSGNLSAITGSAEATLFNPPEETLLFRFSGQHVESSVRSEVGTGSLFTFVSATETSVYNPSEDTALFKITGEATPVIITLSHVGSGTLSAFTGAAEALGSNPPEDTPTVIIRGTAEYQFSRNNSYESLGAFIVRGEAGVLLSRGYDVSGLINIDSSAFESITPAPHIGTGSLFTFVSATEATVVNPPEDTALFKITGSADIQRTAFYPAQGRIEFGSDAAYAIFNIGHVGSGKLNIEGKATESFTPAPHVGRGSLFTFTSTTEAFVVNPPDQTALFSFAGSAVEKSTDVYIGSVDVDIEGAAVTKFNLSQIGSGSLFAIIGTTDSYTASPDDTRVLFKFSGNSAESETNVEIGTGSLFTFVSATEATVVNPPEDTALLKFSGSAIDRFVLNNIGSGSLFAFVSTTEATVVNPPDQTTLFTFSGSAVEKNTEAYLGTGSLFTFVGATEATVVNPPDKAVLFKFTGRAAEAVVPAPHIGSGSIFTFVSFTESTLVVPPTTKDNVFRFVGTATETATNSYRGRGSLFGITGSQDAVAINYAITKVLFTISGRGFEAYARTNYDGYMESRILGQSTDRRVEFKRGQAPRIIII